MVSKSAIIYSASASASDRIALRGDKGTGW
jgi:hypothetical protein